MTVNPPDRGVVVAVCVYRGELTDAQFRTLRALISARSEPDGRIACPVGDAVDVFLTDSIADLERRGLMP